jgi:ABC-type multidrug transport system permease subunit
MLCAWLLRNQFKAHPVNTKILTNPMTGVRRVPTKPLTQPEEFALSHGVPKKKREEEKEDEEFEFHAKPVNKKILEGPVVSAISLVFFPLLSPFVFIYSFFFLFFFFFLCYFFFLVPNERHFTCLFEFLFCLFVRLIFFSFFFLTKGHITCLFATKFVA